MDKSNDKQKALQLRAKIILDELNLLESLKKYGEVHIVGSIALELMDKEDIDIIVLTKPDYEDYLSTVGYLFRKDNVYSLNLQDFRKSIYPDRPQGIYCGVSYLLKPNTFWKIDIWFFSEEKGKESLRLYESIKSQLNEKNMEIIMSLKNKMREAFPESKDIGSIDVYKAVLEHNAQSFNDFMTYLKSRGKIS